MTASIELAENQRHIAELATHIPAVGQHSTVVAVPAGLHDPIVEQGTVRWLQCRHEALRLRVAHSNTVAVPVDPEELTSVEITSAHSRHTVESTIRSWLADAVNLHEDLAVSMRIFPVTGGGHFLAIKASHIAVDAYSRQIFLSDREQFLTNEAGSLAVPALQQWRLYRIFEERSRATEAYIAEIADRLRPATAWQFDNRPTKHEGMQLGPVRIRQIEAPSTVRIGRPAMAFFTVALARLAHRCGLSDYPVVSLPRTYRGPARAPRAFGNFVDHISLSFPTISNDTLTETEDFLRTADKNHLPLRVLLNRLGTEVFSDPAPLTQAVVSYQPASPIAPPFLLDVPGDDEGTAMSGGQHVAPIFVPVTPLERQDIAIICSLYRGQLRWRLSVRAGVMSQDRQNELDCALQRQIEEML